MRRKPTAWRRLQRVRCMVWRPAAISSAAQTGWDSLSDEIRHHAPAGVGADPIGGVAAGWGLWTPTGAGAKADGGRSNRCTAPRALHWREPLAQWALPLGRVTMKTVSCVVTLCDSHSVGSNSDTRLLQGIPCFLFNCIQTRLRCPPPPRLPISLPHPPSPLLRKGAIRPVR